MCGPANLNYFKRFRLRTDVKYPSSSIIVSIREFFSHLSYEPKKHSHLRKCTVFCNKNVSEYYNRISTSIFSIALRYRTRSDAISSFNGEEGCQKKSRQNGNKGVSTNGAVSALFALFSLGSVSFHPKVYLYTKLF